jgi:hypothetical protein
MGPGSSFLRFRGEPSPERGSPFWGGRFRSTPMSRFCHRDPTSNVTSPGAVSRFWASTTDVPRPESENRRAQRRRPTSATQPRCVGTSIRVRRYLARVSGVSQDTLLRAVSGLSEAASSASSSCYRRLRLAEIHRVEVAFPLGTPEPLLDESRTPRCHPFARALLWRSSSRFEKVEGPSAGVVPRRTTALKPVAVAGCGS